jgi:hypothetical protein
MIENQKFFPAEEVRLDDTGSIAGSLPVPRWLARRKSEAAGAAARSGEWTIDEACARYGITVEQFQRCDRAARRTFLGHSLRGSA